MKRADVCFACTFAQYVTITTTRLEKQDVALERCELNRQIRANNALIRTLNPTLRSSKKAVEATIPAIAVAMETVRQNIFMLNYGLLSVWDRQKRTNEYVAQATQKYGDYKDISGQMKIKVNERSEPQTELTNLSVLDIRRRKELRTKIAKLPGEITELQFAKNPLCKPFPRRSPPK